MAEIAGLALGAVGLVTMIGAFKDAIDLFTLLSDTRDHGRDYEIPVAKLDIEKTMLLQWADRVRLVSEEYDRRLDDPDTQKLVTEILSCISLLLGDSTKLQQRYGMSEVSPNDQELPRTEAKRLPRIGEDRTTRFINDFKRMNLRINAQSSTTSTRKKFTWAIRDKQKFATLIDDLSYFTLKINAITPVLPHEDFCQQEAIDADLANITVLSSGDLRPLSILLSASADNQHNLAESIRHSYTQACQNRILSLLWFRKIDDRRESIAVAHEKTFCWALEPPGQTDQKWDSLLEWLQYDFGMYWISGKARSGKSTLLKYLHSEVQKRQLLSPCADGHRYQLYSFFFYHLGTMQQKSQDGLLRALLYQILETHRSLIPDIRTCGKKSMIPIIPFDVKDKARKVVGLIQELRDMEGASTTPSGCDIDGMESDEEYDSDNGEDGNGDSDENEDEAHVGEDPEEGDSAIRLDVREQCAEGSRTPPHGLSIHGGSHRLTSTIPQLLKRRRSASPMSEGLHKAKKSSLAVEWLSEMTLRSIVSQANDSDRAPIHVYCHIYEFYKPNLRICTLCYAIIYKEGIDNDSVELNAHDSGSLVGVGS